jgi:IKI3 family
VVSPSYCISVVGFLEHVAIFHSLFGNVEKNPDLVEDAVKYMIFLVDADKLFDTALGMYDFSLVLMVAQHAQKVELALHLVFVFVDDQHLGPTGVFTFSTRVKRFGQVFSKIQDRRSSKTP